MSSSPHPPPKSAHSKKILALSPLTDTPRRETGCCVCASRKRVSRAQWVTSSGYRWKEMHRKFLLFFLPLTLPVNLHFHTHEGRPAAGR